MGTLMGHVVPGSIFLIGGLWWTFNIWSRYFAALKSRGRFRSTMSFPLRRGSRVPWESIVVIMCAIAAIAGEIVTGWRGDRLVEMGNGQHAVMYFMFAISSAAEAARVTGYELLPGLEYVLAVMALAAEALLFAFHGHGSSELEMLVHHLMLYVVLATGAAAAAEGIWRHRVLPALGRCFFFLLQGTWFLQVGVMLYPPSGWPGHYYDPNSYRQRKLATVVFVLHWVGVLTTIAAIGVFLRWKHGLGLRSRAPRPKHGDRPRNGTDTTQLLHSSDDEL
ncbi:transmembrane protein 45A-like [Amphibalanus amphitrite]|uniref:transmembrane protein 45A-like n=1 Tax=Amphibalanus amphitrite TaxID=1232801 RepID=UPI001C9006E7|nr:transmembrane protein 45A-like [Amphibalanus amphitrite]